MPTRCHALVLLTAAVCIVACSGRVEAPGNAVHGMGGSQATTTSGRAGAGTAGSLPDGTSGGSAGTAMAGSSSEAGTGDETSAQGGAPLSLAADATLMPTPGNSVTGSAHFAQNGDRVEMSVTLSGCPAGPHALHLHANAACGDGGNAAGGHWSPQGDGMGDVTCAADGTAAYSFEPAAGSWSIGGKMSSDLLQHALILHQGPNLPDPGGRIACGFPVKVE